MDKRFAPTTGTVLPRFAGIATFMLSLIHI